jgi:hypothetical protein
MKIKKQKRTPVNDEQQQDETIPETNGHDENTDSNNMSTPSINLTDSDKDKGNFKHFKISKKTVQKLKGETSSCHRPFDVDVRLVFF